MNIQILKNMWNPKTDEKVRSPLEKLVGAMNRSTGKEISQNDSFDIKSIMMEYLDPTAGLSEEEKAAYEERIMRKLRSGKKLSAEEMSYLRAKNPQMYVQAARVQNMRENLEKQLENCKSKEEAEKVYGTAVSMVSKDDPMKEAIIAAYDDAVKEFKKTGEYRALPQQEEREE